MASSCLARPGGSDEDGLPVLAHRVQNHNLLIGVASQFVVKASAARDRVRRHLKVTAQELRQLLRLVDGREGGIDPRSASGRREVSAGSSPSHLAAPIRAAKSEWFHYRLTATHATQLIFSEKSAKGKRTAEANSIALSLGKAAATRRLSVCIPSEAWRNGPLLSPLPPWP